MTNLTDLKLDSTLGEIGSQIKNRLILDYDTLKGTMTSKGGKPPTIVSEFETSQMDWSIIVSLVHPYICNTVSNGQRVTALASTIGLRVRSYYNLPINTHNSVRLGTFILNALAALKLIIIKKARDHKFNSNSKNWEYWAIYSFNKGALIRLKKEFNIKLDPYAPLLDPAEDWYNGVTKDELGFDIPIIKKANIRTLEKVNTIDTPILINGLNKKQHIPFMVDELVFEVYKWALENDKECFEHISNKLISIERREAKKAEANHILRYAEEFLNKNFYQRYNFDYRGRVYALSAYLNELNSDNARGLIKFAEGIKLGEYGREELFHHISNTFGNDKCSHNDRVKFVEDNYDKFVAYGNDPYNNLGWSEADEPFQFLQSVIELSKLDKWIKEGNKAEDFVSFTMIHRDGSNNGLQWLFALAKDEENAHLVNIRPTKDGKPGDVYMKVAESLFEEINKVEVSEENKYNYDTYVMEMFRKRNAHRRAINKLESLKKAKRKNRKLIKKWAVLVDLRNEAAKSYRREHKDKLIERNGTYWKEGQFSPKDLRSVVKRPVMTFGYSATSAGMGEQIKEDTKDTENVYLANKEWSASRWMGKKLFETIDNEFPIVRSTMDFMKDVCVEYIDRNGQQFRYRVPTTNFPFVQNYTKPKKKAVWVDLLTYEDGELVLVSDVQLSILERENTTLDKAKSKNGISPNIVHSLDAAHLMNVIDRAVFQIVTVHDSYSCHAGNIREMQKIIREEFVKIIELDPLQYLLDSTNSNVEMIERGKLNIKEILESEYAFS